MLSDPDAIDPDDVLRQLTAARPGHPIHLRFQPSVLSGSPPNGKRTRAPAQYQAWRGVRWLLRCQTVEEVQAVREALRLFFTVLAEQGPERICERLSAARTEREPCI